MIQLLNANDLFTGDLRYKLGKEIIQNISTKYFIKDLITCEMI